MYVYIYVCVCVCQHFQTSSPLKPLGRLKGKVKFDPLCFCMGKKCKTKDFSETIVVYDIKVGRCSQLNESFISTKGQGYSLTLVQITQIQYF